MERPCIRISVRNLVEFILRSGDLDNRRSKMADKEAMLMGGKIHRKIQKKMESAYQAEVSLRHETIYEEFSIQVEGCLLYTSTSKGNLGDGRIYG